MYTNDELMHAIERLSDKVERFDERLDDHIAVDQKLINKLVTSTAEINTTLSLYFNGSTAQQHRQDHEWVNSRRETLENRFHWVTNMVKDHIGKLIGVVLVASLYWLAPAVYNIIKTLF